MHFGFRKAAGFTLIELMITVAIIGILAAFAIPSYQNYVRTSKRTDATRTMQQDAQTLQRCYSQNFTYVNAAATPCPLIAGASPSPNGNYTITLTIPSPNNAAPSYQLKATPISASQLADKPCARFFLESTGAQSAKDSGGNTSAQITQTCWGSD